MYLFYSILLKKSKSQTIIIYRRYTIFMKKILTLSLITLTPLLITNCGGSSSSSTPKEETSNLPLRSDNNITIDNTVPLNQNIIIKNDITLKLKLADNIKESSGLIKLGNQLWTHNDGGDDANLYQIDESNGNILKIVNIKNATNIDWEDITYDETYVYIGDFGNNNGNRTDLKIYKVLRSDLKRETSITAEVINFNYSDQKVFDDKNFDCEAMVVWQNKLYLFSKNWQNKKTRLYELETSEGTHIANYKDTFDINGLVTGATINKELNILLLSTYSKTLNVNIWSFSNYTNSDFFTADSKKLTLKTPLTAQVEGITFIDKYKAYLSSESFSNTAYNISLDNNLYELDFSKEFE